MGHASHLTCLVLTKQLLRAQAVAALGPSGKSLHVRGGLILLILFLASMTKSVLKFLPTQILPQLWKSNTPLIHFIYSFIHLANVFADCIKLLHLWLQRIWLIWIRGQMQTSAGMEKAREFQKNIYLCFIDYDKAFDCVDHNKLENSWRDGTIRPPDLPP